MYTTLCLMKTCNISNRTRYTHYSVPVTNIYSNFNHQHRNKQSGGYDDILRDNTKFTAYILTGISRTGMLRYGYEMLRFAREMLRFARGKAEHQRKSTRANRNSILQKVRNLNF